MVGVIDESHARALGADDLARDDAPGGVPQLGLHARVADVVAAVELLGQGHLVPAGGAVEGDQQYVARLPVAVPVVRRRALGGCLLLVCWRRNRRWMGVVVMILVRVMGGGRLRAVDCSAPLRYSWIAPSSRVHCWRKSV